MLAIVKTGGKQYKAEVGKHILVEKIHGEPGSSMNLEEVLFVSDEKTGTTIGDPIVKSASVKVKILEHLKTDKIIVFKKKKRQNYRRKQGHRQELSKLEIVEIKK
ncbi:MAG: 50S ribosomal protein L21 [Rickettsiales bacterium]